MCIRDRLTTEAFRTRGLLSRMNVTHVCTTDDPVSMLDWHIKADGNPEGIQLLPGFRPDRFLHIEHKDFLIALDELAEVSNKEINSFDELIENLQTRIDYFNQHHCCISDHGLTHIPFVEINHQHANNAFQRKKNAEQLSNKDIDVYKVTLLHELFKLYKAKSWVTQLHLGPIRNNNSRLASSLGADAGCDSIGDFEQSQGCLLYTSPSPRDATLSRMPSSA